MSERAPFLSNKRGITLIELLVALIICALCIGAIYRVFISQSKAYVVQDQVVEIQQSLRSAMELIVRDLQMTGFDYDNSTSPVKIEDFKSTPPYMVADHSITIWYESYDSQNPASSVIHSITYNLNGTSLERQRTINGVNQTTEVLLENVERFDLRCAIDGRIGDFATQDGVIDQWVNCGSVDNSRDKVIAVEVTLSVKPDQSNSEFEKITPRRLTSTVALRNLHIKKL